MMPAGRTLPLLAACLLAASSSARALDLFVDQAGGDDASDGLSWATAKATVAGALDALAGNPGPHTVSVAAGRYAGGIVVPPDTALLGGFPPGGGPRDPAANPTILDGEGVTDAFGAGVSVVRFPPGSDGTLLDGFTVRGGGLGSGHGILVEDAGPVIRGNIIEENEACTGAGVYVSYSTPGTAARLEGNLIRRNRPLCSTRWGVIPGEVVSIQGSPGMNLGTILSGNRMVDNEGSFSLAGNGGIEHTVIEGNSSGLYLGGSVELFNVAVTRNGEPGITLDCRSTSYRLDNVTVAENGGPGILARYWGGSSTATLAVENSIFWGDGGEVTWECDGPAPVVSSSTVEGGFPGGVNVLDADPLFAAGPGGNFYLSDAAAGQPATSPAVDAGSVSAAAAGLDARTTRTDSVPDAGMVDHGFHYESLPALTVLRGTRADALLPHRTVTSLPFTDDAGTLTDPALPVLFYRVAEASNSIFAVKDLPAETLRFEFRRRP